MTSVIGIDLGSSDSVVAYVGRGTVDIVRNEVSERKTPSVVGFTQSNRLLGEAAMSQIKSNGTNTCRFPKTLIGRRLADPNMAQEVFWQLCPIVEGADGLACYKVNYRNETAVITPTELTAMLFTRLIETTENFTGNKPRDCVISVPPFFSDVHRQAVLDAATIANLNCLRVINDNAATALGYGIYRTADFDESVPTNVVFCSMGHSYFSCSVVQYLKGQLNILSEASDLSVSGRAIEMRMIDRCCEVFKAKFPKAQDPRENGKAKYKLEEVCAKAKKILSANQEASVSVECLIEEMDLSLVVNRGDLEQLCADMSASISACIARAVADSGIADIHNVEITGGCSRIPFVQKAITDSFNGKELSRTLNADECVARGCALQAAILSPLFKVREFAVNDHTAHPIAISWQAAVNEDAEEADTGAVNGVKTAILFQRKAKLGSGKTLTFMRDRPFELQVSYAHPESLLPGTPVVLGHYRLEMPAEFLGKPTKVKVRAELTGNGVFILDGAHALVEEECEEIVKEQRPKEGGAEGEMETVEVTQKKMRAKKVEIPVIATGTVGYSKDQVSQLKKREITMTLADAEVRLRDVARNDLEALVFGTRGKVSSNTDLSDEEKLKFDDMLTAAEDWIYDNYDAARDLFLTKISELKEIFAFLNKKEQENEPMTVEEPSTKEDDAPQVPMEEEQGQEDGAKQTTE